MSSAVLVSQNSLTGHSHPGLPGAVLPLLRCVRSTGLRRRHSLRVAHTPELELRSSVARRRSRVHHTTVQLLAKTQVLVSRLQVHSR